MTCRGFKPAVFGLESLVSYVMAHLQFDAGCCFATAMRITKSFGNARLQVQTHRKFVFRKRNKMLNLKDITAMTFHLNENNNPQKKKRGALNSNSEAGGAS